jgi:hypothetical protein
MKGFIWPLALSSLVLISLGMQAQAQHEGVGEAVTTTYKVTSQTLPLEEGRVRMSYEGTGSVVTSTGQGLFHGATVRSLGGLTMEKGVFNDDRTWGVWTLQNGDKVFFTAAFAGEAKPGGVSEAKGMVTITGGTGKCAGIQDSFPITRYTGGPAVDGVIQSYVKATIVYTLP